MLRWHLPPSHHGPELGPALLLQAWPSKQDSAAAHSSSGSAWPPPMGVDHSGLTEARPRTSTSVECDGEGFAYGPKHLGARARAEDAFRRLAPELRGSPQGVGARAVRVSPRMDSADDCYSLCAAAKRQEGGRCYPGTSLLSAMAQSWALRSWCKPGPASKTRQPHTAAAAVHVHRQWASIMGQFSLGAATPLCGE